MNDKKQLAAMGEHMAEQAAQPMCMAKRIEELEAQVRVMAESLREAISVLSSINNGGEHEVHIEGDEPAFWQRGEWVDWAKSEVLPKLQAALAGTLPERPDTEWTDAASIPSAQDYRELQAQHDQLQSKHKAALDALSSAVKTAEFEGHAHRQWHDSAKTLLTGQVPVLSPHQSLLDWAVTSWHEQVAHRPMENVYRRTLDSVWRQVIRFAGEDPQSIIGPSHDDLLHAAAPKLEAK